MTYDIRCVKYDICGQVITIGEDAIEAKTIFIFLILILRGVPQIQFFDSLISVYERDC